MRQKGPDSNRSETLPPSVHTIHRQLFHGGGTSLVSVVKNDITFADSEFHKREARIIGSRNALKADFECVTEAMRSGDVPTEAIASETIGLIDMPKRFSGLVENREHLVKVLATP